MLTETSIPQVMTSSKYRVRRIVTAHSTCSLGGALIYVLKNAVFSSPQLPLGHCCQNFNGVAAARLPGTAPGTVRCRTVVDGVQVHGGTWGCRVRYELPERFAEILGRLGDDLKVDFGGRLSRYLQPDASNIDLRGFFG